MKRKLNLNGPSTRIVKLIGTFAIVVPLGLQFLSLLLRTVHAPGGAVPYLQRASVAVGLGILAVFILLIVVEYVQDVWMDRLYRHNRRRRLPLADGLFECQHCGNRHLREADRSCPVCGKALE